MRPQGDFVQSLFGPPPPAVPYELLPFPALVTAVTQDAAGFWRYAFLEQSWDPATGAWASAVPGRFGDVATGIGLAFESRNIRATPPFVVNQMRPRGLVGGQMVCDFDAPPAASAVTGGEFQLQPTAGRPADAAPPGVLRYDVTFVAGGAVVLWLSYGGGLWVAVCPCPGSALATGSLSGSAAGGSGVAVPCCPGVLVPRTLYLVVSGATGPGCNGTYTLVYGGTSTGGGGGGPPRPNWSTDPANGGPGPDTYGECGPTAWQLYCDTASNSWKLANTASNTTVTVSSANCSPLNLTFALPAACACGAATGTVIA